MLTSSFSLSLNFRFFFLYDLWFIFRLFSCAHFLCYTLNYHRWICVFGHSCYYSLMRCCCFFYVFGAIKMSIECLVRTNITEREREGIEVTNSPVDSGWITISIAQAHVIHPHLVVPHNRQIFFPFIFSLSILVRKKIPTKNNNNKKIQWKWMHRSLKNTGKS